MILTLKLPSACAVTMARWYSVRPGFLRMGSRLLAFKRGGWILGSSARAPIICQSAGRTKAKKVTITATGFPGRPNSGTFPNRPTAMGRPGRIAIFQNTTPPSPGVSLCANSRIMALVWSASPTLTPPLVTMASACCAALRNAAFNASGSSRTTPISMHSMPMRCNRPQTV